MSMRWLSFQEQERIRQQQEQEREQELTGLVERARLEQAIEILEETPWWKRDDRPWL